MKNRSRLAGIAGFTLVEVLVAAGVALVGFLAVTLLNTAHLRYVKSARQSNAASLCLQERVEQLRLADWRKLTNSSYLQDTLLATATKSAAPLDQISEKVTVAAFPDDTVATKLIVQRNSAGQRSTVSSGTGLDTQRMAKIDLQVNWSGADGRTRTRATTTLIANGGISRMNLPAFGAAAGAPTSSTPAAATPTPTPSGGSNPGATPTPTPAITPTPTPTPTPKKNSRGNVGGKSGSN